MDHVPMKIHQASTVDHQHQWCFHQKHMTANVVNPKHVTNESRVICTPPRSPRLIWKKNSWMALNDAMPKIKTWYWSMESGFAWNPPLLRGPRRYGNGAAMKTIRKNQNLSETRHMFSGTGTDTGKLQLEPCHCELQPNTPTGWQFMRHTVTPKWFSRARRPPPFPPKQRVAWKVLNLSGSNGGWPGSWKLPAWHDDQTTKSVHFTNVFLKRPSTYRRLVSQKIGTLALPMARCYRWMIRHTAADTAARLPHGLPTVKLPKLQWSCCPNMMVIHRFQTNNSQGKKLQAVSPLSTLNKHLRHFPCMIQRSRKHCPLAGG